jgi:hypothetical protein
MVPMRMCQADLKIISGVVLQFASFFSCVILLRDTHAHVAHLALAFKVSIGGFVLCC